MLLTLPLALQVQFNQNPTDYTAANHRGHQNRYHGVHAILQHIVVLLSTLGDQCTSSDTPDEVTTVTRLRPKHEFVHTLPPDCVRFMAFSVQKS